MLDQLLKDFENRHTIAEDTSSSKAPLKGVQLASEEDVRHKNWLITLTNIQVALKGIETSGYVVASSNKAQVFGQEHQPVLTEGDLVSKNSWLTCVDKLQYFSTFGSMVEEGCVPWLPPSVISSPSPQKNRTAEERDSIPRGFLCHSDSIPRDSESSLNALLSQLGPARAGEGGEEEGEIDGSNIRSSSREVMVGGLVNCLLIPADRDTGRQELRGGAIRGASLQRIASRCQCSIIYVSYGGQAEPKDCDSAVLTPESASPGLAENRSEAVDTITVTYPTVKICTTSPSPPPPAVPGAAGSHHGHHHKPGPAQRAWKAGGSGPESSHAVHGAVERHSGPSQASASAAEQSPVSCLSNNSV
jgi:hypothetical protein